MHARGIETELLFRPSLSLLPSLSRSETKLSMKLFNKILFHLLYSNLLIFSLSRSDLFSPALFLLYSCLFFCSHFNISILARTMNNLTAGAAREQKLNSICSTLVLILLSALRPARDAEISLFCTRVHRNRAENFGNSLFSAENPDCCVLYDYAQR